LLPDIWSRGELAAPHSKRRFEEHLKEVMKEIDFHAAQVLGHRQNIERYCRLLATNLTELERQYLHKRIAEEHAELERLEKRQAGPGHRSRAPEATEAATNSGHATPHSYAAMCEAAMAASQKAGE
jgi:hypothetical protein